MKIITLLALGTLAATAACANEAAQGGRNTGTANENGAPLIDQAPQVPAVTIDTATTTSTAAAGGDSSTVRSAQATQAVDSAAAARVTNATDSAAH
ncbi:MAG TPA: hypothetical protein VF625_12255 [Longimicrobium sp.]|jgi:RNase H-fold protein (predicted Holliday junction resolvase)